MRSFIFLLIALLCWPVAPPPRAASQTGPKIVDDRAPFAIELPELNTGILLAGAHPEISVPPKQRLTRIKLWVVEPFATRVGYRINATFNNQSTVTSRGRGTAGNFLDINLLANPNLAWKADKNVLEVTAQEGLNGITYRCSFVLLPNRSGKASGAPAEGCATEMRTDIFLAPEDPHVLQSDRVAPQLTLTAPGAAFNATSGAQTVLVTGSASDDSGYVRSVTVNGQVIAGTPMPKDKRFKLPPLKKGDKKAAPAPPPPLTFNTNFLVTLGTRALLVEATDYNGNRTLITIPILQPDCADAMVAQRQAALASATTTGFSGRRYAVIIGVSDYKYSEGGLSHLQFADQDALALAAWLRRSEGGGFQQQDIVCLTNHEATKDSIRQALAGFLDKAGANDLVYLFLAGHGAPDKYDPQKLYFLLHTSKLTDLPGTALPMTELGQFVSKKSEQARLIAFFDTCHSAGIKGQPLSQPAAKPAAPQGARGGAKPDTRGIGNKKPNAPGNSTPPPQSTPTTPAPATNASFNFYDGTLFREKGWTVITSSSLTEESKESMQWRDQAGNGHGVFTWALLDGLQGNADVNGDCRITAAELFAYIRKTVSTATSGAQNPQALPGGSGDFVVASVPGKAGCKGVSVTLPRDDENRPANIRDLSQSNAAISQADSGIPQQTLPLSATRQKENKQPPHGRALLVGVNRYAQPYVPPTPGAEEDALAMRELLIRQYGFRAGEIKLLLGPEATAANIVAEFRRLLIAETQPGDHIFFHYSGHGSRVPDDDGDEADGFDEVLAPYDVALQGTDSFANIIRDDLIGALIGELKGRQAVLVFDSCYSGTISRNTGSARIGDAAKPRYLPAPAELSRLQTPSRGLGGGAAGYEVSDFASEAGSRQLRKRDLKLVKEKLDDSTARIAVISAAQAGQLAYPVKVAGGDRGALSYLFTETQRERALSFNELRAQITAQMAVLNNGKRKQTPVFEVLTPFPLDAPLFGSAPLIAPALAFANPDSALKVALRTREDKRLYHVGEDISYEVTTSAPGYLYLLVFSQKQVATCIFPTKAEPDNYVSQGPHRLPRTDTFQVQEPAGKDITVALLSSARLNLGDQEDLTWDEVFARLRSNKLAGYINRRGVGTKKPGQTSAPPISLDDADWQAASLVIEILAGPTQAGRQVPNPLPSTSSQVTRPVPILIPVNVFNIREVVYRKVADQLVAENRLDDAQQVIERLKQEEYRKYFPPDDEETSPQPNAPKPSPAEVEQKEIDKKLKALSDEQRDLLPVKVKTEEGKSRLAAIDREVGKIAENFESFLGRTIKESGNKELRATRWLGSDLQDLGAGTVAIYTIVGKERYSVILVTPNSQPIGRQATITAADLEQKVADFRRNLQDPKQDPLPLAQELYRILLGPIEEDLQRANAKTLMWSLDGALRYLPMAALHDGNQYLVERYRNTMFTLTSYMRLKETLNSKWNVLGLGTSKAVAGANALPAVRAELLGIIDEHRGKRPKGLFPGNIKLDQAFTMEALLNRPEKKYSVVHIASHFGFQPGDAKNTVLLLGNGYLLNLPQIKAFPNMFRGLELLNLSACNTAMGGKDADGQEKEADGREIESFAELAQQQGAKSVIASLWSVNDKSTASLMQKFYAARKANPALPKAEALQLAQRSLLLGSQNLPGSRASSPRVKNSANQKRAEQLSKTQYNHPYYWAPFILIGHWK